MKYLRLKNFFHHGKLFSEQIFFIKSSYHGFFFFIQIRKFLLQFQVLCDMMEALTGDTRFLEQTENLLQKERKGEKIMMCEYINQLEARGEANGEKKGEAKLTSLLEKLYALGRDEEAKQAVRNLSIRAKLYEEFCIPNASYEN